MATYLTYILLIIIYYIYIFYWQHEFTKFVGKNNLKKNYLFIFLVVELWHVHKKILAFVLLQCLQWQISWKAEMFSTGINCVHSDFQFHLSSSRLCSEPGCSFSIGNTFLGFQFLNSFAYVRGDFPLIFLHPFCYLSSHAPELSLKPRLPSSVILCAAEMIQLWIMTGLVSRK